MVLVPVNTDSPYYRFTTRLTGNSYRITIRFNAVVSVWYMDIEGLTNAVKLYGLALITGSNLIAPYAIRELGSMFVYDLSGRGTNPTRDSLGKGHLVAYMDPGEVLPDAI